MNRKNNKPSQDSPSFFSDAEMDILKQALPSDEFLQFKYWLLELVGYVEREEYDKVEAFRENMKTALGDAGVLFSKLETSVHRFKQGVRNGYHREKMKEDFLQRLKKQVASPYLKEVISGFPVNAKQKKKAKAKNNATKYDIKALIDAKRKTTVKKKKRVSADKVASPLTKADIRQETGVFLNAVGDSLMETHVVSPTYSNAKTQETHADGSELPTKKKKVQKILKQEKVKPKKPHKKVAVKKPQSNKDLDSYYKKRSDRIKNYIEKDQKKGSRVQYKEKIGLGNNRDEEDINPL